MEPTRLRLGELLVDARIITPEQLAEVLEIQKEDGRRLGILLVERGLVNETQLTQILSQQLSVPWVSLYHVDFSKRLLSMVPRDVAVKYCLVPIYVRHVRGQGDTLYVAMYDPTNVEALRICAAWSGLPTRAMIASPSDIRNAIDVYYGPEPTAEPATDEQREDDKSEATGEEVQAEQVPPAQAPGEDGPRADTQVEVAQREQEPPAEAQGGEAESPPPDAEPGPIDEQRDVPVEQEASDGSFVAVSAEQEPVEERFADAGLAPAEEVEQPQSAPADVAAEQEPRADAEPPAEALSQPSAEEPAPAAEPAYDDSVSVEVGHEVPLEEILRRRPAAEAAAEQPAQPAPRTKSGRMIALTLLDGTTLALPTRQAKKARPESLVKALRGAPEAAAAPASEPEPAPKVASSRPPAAPASTRPPPEELPSQAAGLTGRDVVAALRAAAHGVDPSDILGSNARWETMLATVLSLMLRKGLITDEELAEELKKI